MLTVKTKENRVNRFSIRTTEQEKELVTRVARRLNKTVSEFILENAIETAEALEMDNANFVISKEKYEEFLAVLDQPTKPIPELQKLFSEPSVFDE